MGMQLAMAIKRAPKVCHERVDHGQPQTGHGHDHDKQHGHGRGRAGDPSDLRACDFREGVAIATQGPDQDDEILDRAGHTAPIRIQRNPGKNPNCAARTGPNHVPAPAMAANMSDSARICSRDNNWCRLPVERPGSGAHHRVA